MSGLLPMRMILINEFLVEYVHPGRHTRTLMSPHVISLHIVTL